jgi:CcmD family protein
MENAVYLWAAFTIIWALVFGYVWLLVRRQTSIKRQLDAMKETFKQK